MAHLANLITAAECAERSVYQTTRIVDATWTIPGTKQNLPDGVIPGAIFFDLSIIKSMPLTDQTPGFVAKMLGDIGLRPSDDVIIYDRRGIFSAQRLWFLLGQVGHDQVSILNGGLSAWIAEGFGVDEKHHQLEPTTYPLSDAQAFNVNTEEVLDAIGTNCQIIDARPHGRFIGEAPEPRPGLRSGRIPGSISLPYASLLEDGLLRPDAVLQELINKAGIDLTQPIITTCGSGVTAAGLTFILARLGAKDVKVYTGSWAEWGASDLPIETG